MKHQMKKKLAIHILISCMLLLLLVVMATADEALITHCRSAPTGVETCIKDNAIKRNDPSLCELIESDSMRGSCYGAFAARLNDIELCRKIPKDARGADARNRCYLKFVKTADDLSICTELIHEERAKDDCYSEILDFKRDDPSFCTYFSTDKKRLNCYLKVIRRLDNPELCSLILGEGSTKRKSQCRYCEEDGINYDKEYQKCKKSFFLENIENRCDVHGRQLELKMAKGEKTELTFTGESTERERFWITFHWAVLDGTYETYAANIRFTDGVRHEAFDGLRIGQAVAGQNDLGVQLLDVWTEEESRDDERPSDVVYARLCVFRPSTQSTHEKEGEGERGSTQSDEEFRKEQERKKQELLKELQEQQREKEEEEMNAGKNSSGSSDAGRADATDAVNGENRKKEGQQKDGQTKDEDEQKKSRVKVREGGVFARLFGFLQRLFGG